MEKNTNVEKGESLGTFDGISQNSAWPFSVMNEKHN